MKTYKYLYDDFISEENIKLAIHNASLGKHDRKIVLKVNTNIDYYIEKFLKICKKFHNNKHTPKEIYDGVNRKKRLIFVPTFYEQVVHHMIVNILKPIFLKPMYEYSCGSIPGRGIHKAKKRLSKWLKNDDAIYCLKMDVKKYFDSIPHDILKLKLEKKIKDKKFLKILFTVIDVRDVGIPIGFYTSQWLANFYLTDLDHYIKETLRAKYYIRYMDDMIILGDNKDELYNIQQEVSKQLILLGLEMKNNWLIFKIKDNHSGKYLDFMGFKFSKYNIILRRNLMLKISRKSKRLSKKKLNIYLCRQMLSYLSWIKYTNTYNFYLHHIKPYVNIKNLRRYISNHDKNNKIEL